MNGEYSPAQSGRAVNKKMREKYNIAIIAGQLVVGGAERQLYLWLAHLDRKKFQPVVLTLHPGHGDYWEDHIEALGIPLLRIQHHRSRIQRLHEIIRILRPYEPHLIHGWHLFVSPYAGAVAKLLGTKSLGSLRDSYRMMCNAPLEAKLTLLLVDAMLANSYSAAQQLITRDGLGKPTIYAVQNAIEDQTGNRLIMRDKLSQKYGIPPTNVWIGSLGRLDPKKRFDLLLKAIALLHDEVKDFNFILIGSGAERTSLERLVEMLHISKHVTFTGEIPAASAWLSAMDIFCFTSLDEGIPNAVMEAAVAGLPVVSWRVPFIEELLKHGEVALLVEPENLVDFKDALVKLIQSQTLRHTIGKAARNHVINQFSLQRYVQSMTNVYDELLGAKRSSYPGEE